MITIDNKHNIGDTLWRIYENKPTACIVESIEFHLVADTIANKRLLYYTVKNLGSGYLETYKEDELDEIFYTTKEKCILSLFDK